MMNHRYRDKLKLLAITIADDLLSTNVDVYQKDIFEIMGGPGTSNWKDLELDLTGVKRLDSMGLNLLVNILNEVRNRGGKMTTLVRPGTVQQALIFTNLDRQMTVVVQ